MSRRHKESEINIKSPSVSSAQAVEQTASASASHTGFQVLVAFKAVGKRPSMYIGDISEKGLHHLVIQTYGKTIVTELARYAIQITPNDLNAVIAGENNSGMSKVENPVETIQEFFSASSDPPDNEAPQAHRGQIVPTYSLTIT